MHKIHFLAFGLIFFLFTAQAQEGPKLGLILSGGGAKGMAHVGVLKAMEEAGLRPDFIAGTSMGSIVGGLYALGYSADEIDRILREVDWDQLLSNEVPLNYIAFEEKEYYDRYLLEFPMQGFRPKIGTGLIRGQMLSELMHYYFWPAHQYDHFDDFPIPFRCVATDVKNGQPLVIESGPMPAALRASMAIPTAFTAVYRGDTLLVDGGVLNNFPVELAQARGMDYIIGVNVGTDPEAELPEDMSNILMRLAMLESTEKLKSQIEACDIYLQPPLQDYSSASFSKAEEILAIGDSTGAKFLPAMQALARKMGLDSNLSHQPLAEFLIDVDSIEIRGNQLFSDALILKKLGIEVGQSVHRRDLEQGIRRVFGINGFKNVNYDFKQVGDQRILEIQVLEKERNYLFASVHADNLFSSGIVLNYTSRDLIFSESRTVFSLDISRNPRFRFDYYKYLSQNKRFALNLRYDYTAQQLPIYDEGELQDISLSFDNRLHLEVMTTQSLKESYALGVFHERNRSIFRIGNELPEGLRYSNQNNSGVRFWHTANDLNDRNFPVRGGESLIIANFYFDNNNSIALERGVDSIQFPDLPGIWFAGTDINDLIQELSPQSYLDLLWSYRSYQYLNEHWQLVPYGGLGLSLGDAQRNSVVQGFRLGGMQRVFRRDIRVLGLQLAEEIVPNFALAGLQAQYLWQDLFLRFGANILATNSFLGFSDWEPFLFQGQDDDFEFLLGMGVEATYRTFIGPISAGISTNQRDWQPRYYVGIGFSFNYSD